MKKKFIYLGLDKRFWQTLQEEFVNIYGKIHDFDFQTIHNEDKDNGYKVLYRQLKVIKPQAVFIDYSVNKESLLKLTYLLRRTNSTNNISVIGLFDHISGPEVRTEILKAGCLAAQVKNGNDIQGVIYDTYSLAFPEGVVEPSFYQVKTKDGTPFELEEQCRVNFITQDLLQVECHSKFAKEQVVELETALPEDLVPSWQYEVIDTPEGNHYFEFPNKALFRRMFIDRVMEAEHMSKLEKAKKADEKEARIKEVAIKREEFGEWVKKQQKKKSTPKNVKILIVDHNLEFLSQTDQWLSDYPYPLKCQTHLVDAEKEVIDFKPDIIAFRYEEESEDETNEHLNNKEALKQVVDAIIPVKDYDPFIMVSDCEIEAQDLRDSFSYPQILTSKAPFSLAALFAIAEKFNKKHQPRFESETKDKIIPKKKDPMSHVTYKQKLDIINLTELSMEFISPVEPPLNTVYFTKFPTEMYLTTVPHRTASPFTRTPNCYRAIIHTISEENKKKLRQYIIQNK